MRCIPYPRLSIQINKPWPSHTHVRTNFWPLRTYCCATGSFGKVYLVRNKVTRSLYALKVWIIVLSCHCFDDVTFIGTDCSASHIVDIQISHLSLSLHSSSSFLLSLLTRVLHHSPHTSYQTTHFFSLLNLPHNSLIPFPFLQTSPLGPKERLHRGQRTSRAHQDGTVRTGVRAPPLHSRTQHGFPGTGVVCNDVVWCGTAWRDAVWFAVVF